MVRRLRAVKPNDETLRPSSLLDPWILLVCDFSEPAHFPRELFCGYSHLKAHDPFPGPQTLLIKLARGVAVLVKSMRRAGRSHKSMLQSWKYA